MASGSYTLLPFISPSAAGADIVNQVGTVGSVNNNFLVSQSMAGIANAGAIQTQTLGVSGAALFSGVATFIQQPVFSAGISIPSEIDLGTLQVNGLSSLVGGVTGSTGYFSGMLTSAGGLTVQGAVSLPASSIVQSEVSGGYVDLASAQSVAGIKTFSSPPVMSGASVTSATMPAAALTKSVSDAVIVAGGVGQASVASGYVDLLAAQTIAGIKTFSSTISGTISRATVADSITLSSDNSAGSYFVPFSKTVAGNDTLFIDDTTSPLTYNPSTGTLNTLVATLQSVAVSAAATIGTTLSVGGLLSANGGLAVTGALTLPASSVVQSAVSNGYVDLVNPQTIAGLKNFSSFMQVAAISASGLLTALGNFQVSGTSTVQLLTCANLTNNGNLILTQSQTALVSAANVAINLNSLSMNTFTLTQSQNLTGLTITNLIPNAKFTIFVTVSGARTLNKALSTAPVTIVNNLAGNQAAATGSIWMYEGFVVSATSVYLTITNLT